MKHILQCIIVVLATAWVAGCTVFEQTPEDVQQKLTNPGGGHLYQPDPSQVR